MNLFLPTKSKAYAAKEYIYNPIEKELWFLPNVLRELILSYLPHSIPPQLPKLLNSSNPSKKKRKKYNRMYKKGEGVRGGKFPSPVKK